MDGATRAVIADASPDALLAADPNGRLLWANRAAERLFGWRAEDWVGANCLEMLHPDDVELAALSLLTVADKEVGTPLEVRVATADGWRLVEVIGTIVPLDDGTSTLVLSLRDLTQRRRWEVASDSDAMERSLIHNAASLTLLVAADGTLRSASGALTRALGHDPEIVTGRPMSDLVHPEDRAVVLQAMVRARRAAAWSGGSAVSVEARLIRRHDGEGVPYELTLVGLQDDPTVEGLVISGHDISRLRAAQEALHHQAHHDTLTGLPNRLALAGRLREMLEGDGRHGVTVCFVDLDRFKPVNDLFGHESGDHLLLQLGRRLSALVIAGGCVARIGGDEFAVAVPGLTAIEAERLRHRIEGVVSDPFDIGASRVQVYASVGVVTARRGDDPDRVITEADAVMTSTKRSRRGAKASPMLPLDRQRMIAEDLGRAFEDEQLRVSYQPIVELESGRIVGAEALIRWAHPRLGELSPDEFLTVAEDIGRDREISELVVRDACRVIAEAEAAGVPLSVSVNVSAMHLTSHGFDQELARLLMENAITPGLLCIEVTERAILERAASGPSMTVEAALEKVHALGVQIAIDDFGTGFSSLSHLMTFPIDVLKIDRSFVEGVATDRRSRSVVRSLLALSEGLGLKAVAEGVETPQQLEALRSMGCPFGQGYLLGRPMLATELLAGPA